MSDQSNKNTYLLLAAGAAFGAACTYFGTRKKHQNLRKMRLVSNPHPEWKIGDKQVTPFQTNSWKEFDPLVLGKRSTYKLMISAVVPRPIALVSSVSSDGKLNCAPYSYFSAIAHDPPMLAIGICNTDLRKDITDRKKDTLVNIEETRSYVVNIMSEWYVNAANHTCGPYTPDVNEVELSGLTTVPSVKVKAPRIAEAAVQMECELHHVEKIYNDKGEHTTSLVLGRVVRFHVHDDVVEYGSGKEDRPLVSIEKLKPLGRVGGVRYTTIGDAFDLARPTK